MINKLETLTLVDDITDVNLQNVKELYLPLDKNGREIFLHKINNVKVVGNSVFYPNTFFYSDINYRFYNVIEERTMSLLNVTQKSNDIILNEIFTINNDNLFFFNYNLDNYYHFIYDTLPYLISYFELKKRIPSLKLLMSLPNSEKSDFYQFNKEFFEILNIDLKNDVVLIDKNTSYKNLYVSSSYTHGIDSNLPPRHEIYDFYHNFLVNIDNSDEYKKIYISRRTHLHNSQENIGTNYTTRRKMVNEDELVDTLKLYGYKEVFTETLTTIEKLKIFYNSTYIIGSIGGGLCNVLFSNLNCKLITIVSPTFLDINDRFKYSLDVVDNYYFLSTNHISNEEFKIYMRVEVNCNNIIGEITEIDGDKLLISYSESNVSGWNNNINFKTKWVNKNDCKKLDNGLNSPYTVNIDKLIEIICE